MAPRLDLRVDPHIASALGHSLRQKVDVDDVSVATDHGCGGQDASHAPEDVNLLN